MIAPNKQQNLNVNAETTPHVSGFAVFIWYLSFILIVPIIIHIVNVNKIRRMDTKIYEAESGIDIQLKRRRDTLIKLMDSVQGSIKFEKETLKEVTNMRMGGSIQDKMENSVKLDKIAKNVTLQVERYPDLKTNKLINDLMISIVNIEEDIAASRRIYNSNVSHYNQAIRIFPHNIAARALGVKAKYFFEITEAEREDVKINF